MSDPFATLKWAQSLGQSKPLTAIGGGIAGLLQQRQAAQSQALAQQQYREALRAYTQNQNPDTLSNLYMAAEPLGIFENAKSAAAGIDTSQRQADVRDALNLIAPIYSGQNDIALQNFDTAIAALQNEGAASEQIQQMQMMRDRVAEGRGNEVSTYLSAVLGTTPEGIEAIKNLHAMNTDRSNQLKSSLDVLKTGRETIGTPEEIDALKRAAEQDPVYGRDVLAALAYAQGLNAGGEFDPEFTVSQIENLRKEWTDVSESFRNAQIANTNAQGLLDKALSTDGGGEGTYIDPRTGNEVPVRRGVHDVALIQLVQRQIDDAVVRKDDFENLQNTMGIMSQIASLSNRVLQGEVLTDPERRELGRVSELLLEAQQRYVDTVVYPSRKAHLGLLGYGPGSEQYEATFGLYAPKYTPDEEWDIGEARQTTGTSFVPPTGRDIERDRAAMRELTGDTNFDFRNATYEQMARRFPDAYQQLLQMGQPQQQATPARATVPGAVLTAPVVDEEIEYFD